MNTPAALCPTCNGKRWVNGRLVATRETVGMVCQTCGTDYAADRSIRLVPRKPGEQEAVPRQAIEWTIEFFVDGSLTEQPAVVDMALRSYLDRGREDAAAADVDLFGDPEVTVEPAEWVDNWRSDGGAAMVRESTARAAHRWGEPRGVFYRIAWRATKKPMRRMKRSDIDDQHVIDLARQWQESPSWSPGVVEALIAEGIPRKLAQSKVEHLSLRGFLDYGVSVNCPWPTGKKVT